MKNNSHKKLNKESYKPSASLIRAIKTAEKDFKMVQIKSYNNIKDLIKELNTK
jgi:hypothetical protein